MSFRILCGSEVTGDGPLDEVKSIHVLAEASEARRYSEQQGLRCVKIRESLYTGLAVSSVLF